MQSRVLKVTINGTGFAGDYTARVYGQIPHKNGVRIELAGVTSGRRENAERFIETHGLQQLRRDGRGRTAGHLLFFSPDACNIAFGSVERCLFNSKDRFGRDIGLK
jgi:hypothetical protein